jgi:hypothetical protein
VPIEEVLPYRRYGIELLFEEDDDIGCGYFAKQDFI